MPSRDTRKIKGFFALVLLGPVLIAIGALVAMVLGAAAGWAGGLIFPAVFANMSALLWEDPVPAWQIGAMLGFLAGFLRISQRQR